MRTKKSIIGPRKIIFISVALIIMIGPLNPNLTESIDLHEKIEWLSINPNSPQGTIDLTTMSYDIANQKTILFGGRQSGVALQETWEFDSTTGIWSPITPTVSADARWDHDMVYDSQNEVHIIFGGTDVTDKADTVYFNYTANSWFAATPANSPSARNSAMMSYDSVHNKVILFGGYNGTLLGDTWVYDFNADTWTEMFPTNSPAPRADQAMAFDPVRQTTIIHGGWAGSVYTSHADTWEYDFVQNDWTRLKLGGGPIARHSHDMVWDALNQKMVLFGGCNDAILFSDVWFLDHSTMNWKGLVSPTVPVARCSYGVSYDLADQSMILFGGTDGAVQLEDTWKFSWILNTFQPTPDVPYPQNTISMGGTAADDLNDITLFPNGALCAVGDTFSSSWFNSISNPSSGNGDGFIVCVDEGGSQTASLLLGGSLGRTHIFGSTITEAGEQITVGSSGSPNLGFLSSYINNEDAWIIINARGGFYVGGDQGDFAYDVTTDNVGNIAFGGYTYSTSFTTGWVISGGNDVTHGGNQDGFIVKISNLGNLRWSTYVGGSGNDQVNTMSFDSQGNMWVFGWTDSADFPTTVNAFETMLGGTSDYFIQKYHSNGTLLFSSYLGGDGAEWSDVRHQTVVDSNDNFVITGTTNSLNYPTINGLNSTDNGGATDGVITKLAPNGSIVWSTYLGGDGEDHLYSLALDRYDNIIVGGYTDSVNMPIQDGFQSTNLGLLDGVLFNISSAGDALHYSTFFGSHFNDGIYAVQVNNDGHIIAAGNSDFAPHLPGMAETGPRSAQGANDIFITRIYADRAPVTATQTQTESFTTTETSTETSTEISTETSFETSTETSTEISIETSTDSVTVTEQVGTVTETTTATETATDGLNLNLVPVVMAFAILAKYKFKRRK